MSNYLLTAEPILEGFAQKFKGIELFEITDRAMVSIAIPKGGKNALENQLKQEYQLVLPYIGQWLSSNVEHTQLLRLQDDLCFVVFDYTADRAVEKIAEKITNAYLSDQSDSWVMLRLSGVKSCEALARICPIDLHPTVFRAGSVARTQMEHMGVIIVCEAKDEYTLMALRSYAKSFLHSIVISINNITV